MYSLIVGIANSTNVSYYAYLASPAAAAVVEVPCIHAVRSTSLHTDRKPKSLALVASGLRTVSPQI